FDQLRDPSEGMVYPFPAATSAGWLYVYVLMDPTQKLGSGLLGLNDAALRTKDGRVIWLIGPADALSVAPGSGGDQSPAPDQTDTGSDTPADGSSGEDPEG
ncbi:MAG: hypothetical protein ACF8LK_10170, partial [Phycisphaerales bacterium JB041]